MEVKKIEKVKEGSMLTSKKMNEIIENLNTLQEKVESLEKRASGWETVSR